MISVGAFLAWLSAAPAQVSLNFNLSDLSSHDSNEEPIGDYYSGGTDAGGATGPNYGVSFGADALTLKNYPGSNTGGSPGGGANLNFLSGPGAVMNLAGGFTTGFSFYYSAPFFTGSVKVYGGLNGTGALLANLFLPLTPDGERPPYNLPYDYGVWEPIGVNFAGTAESVDFTGNADYIEFADVTIGAATPQITNNIPDVTGLGIFVLAGLGLAGVACASRKPGIPGQVTH
jgi:hypothetical protein